jgi:ABC-type glycerol-3-phosphate transport system substrate-binding protein
LKKIFNFLMLGLLIVGMTSCSTDSGADPANATLAYLEALAAKDKDTVVSLVCKDWEEQAILEVDALLSVGAELNNVTCSQTGTDGEDALVVCDGSLDLTYNDEIRASELSSRTYTMTMEDGQWRVCSYQ